ncbi:unnamed protein product [Prorocentrum cordatum]|uniref:Uncharacterized protein n=1 Tax=Prorocentrum cordatum TaxID=2364126 RepID=A0ABN9RDF0_9DINO|nr:unnamed protein product [Polarella glacialis]
MHQLWSDGPGGLALHAGWPDFGGAPFRRCADGTLRDRRGERVALHAGAGLALAELADCPSWRSRGVVVGVASCSSEPQWARACLRAFRLGDGRALSDLVDVVVIMKGSKTAHLRSIAAHAGCTLQEVLFVDNEPGGAGGGGVEAGWVPKPQAAYCRLLLALSAGTLRLVEHPAVDSWHITEAFVAPRAVGVPGAFSSLMAHRLGFSGYYIVGFNFEDPEGAGYHVVVFTEHNNQWLPIAAVQQLWRDLGYDFIQYAYAHYNL